MSLIFTVYTQDSIVLAADSRLCYHKTPNPKDRYIDYSVFRNDTSYKVFLCPNDVGISCCGVGMLNGKLFSSLVQKFIDDNIKTSTIISDMPEMIITYFSDMSKGIDLIFHVAGFDGVEFVAYRVSTASETIERCNSMQSPGATWDGESEIATRLLKGVAVTRGDEFFAQNIKDGTPGDNRLVLDRRNVQLYDETHIPWALFTTDDAINFLKFIFHTTIDALEYSMREKTVGGPVDILVIKKDKSYFAQRK